MSCDQFLRRRSHGGGPHVRLSSRLVRVYLWYGGKNSDSAQIYPQMLQNSWISKYPEVATIGLSLNACFGLIVNAWWIMIGNAGWWWSMIINHASVMINDGWRRAMMRDAMHKSRWLIQPMLSARQGTVRWIRWKALAKHQNCFLGAAATALQTLRSITGGQQNCCVSNCWSYTIHMHQSSCNHPSSMVDYSFTNHFQRKKIEDYLSFSFFNQQF